MKTKLEHQKEADLFYEIQKTVKINVKNNSKISAISIDFEKNLLLPVTKVSCEYYMRQLWLHNFCIHDMETEKANMFLYSEHFAGKGPNEVISIINFYINNLVK